ncbi:UDP-N-acetylglucosamine 2-epimerase (non-hydrolyzing) [Lutimonas saemankumensis]|uniref:non-hydrolyzing UDP-N-acetylglucosamine 2-epimerase n=1 Tax=Lutimonas saemankumensis TaxID=483016 RepID=UPI001CD24644|nr:UDP-N-acetylglucosamine 2-epimerase (non-hydrolyzing) [Lutimonas saemankumensis]MCA0933794.1 UDP-N-acetylglucosamine 2-epimerase (non-hydrolyzing) [Lutimonas saemankumensis]
MKKIVSILGARPQFIKAAVLSRIIREQGEFAEVIIHTGQHFDQNMSDVFFDEMDIPKPQYNLEVNNLGHGAMTGRMLEGIEEILLKENPDLVVVYGDTNSTLAGALAAKKLGVPVAHVEAGLRSFNMEMPEEVNRILTDRISDLLMCPTQSSVANLKSEGFDHFDADIVLSGDIMKDSVAYYSGMSSQKSTLMDQLSLEGNSFVLATVHRQENTDDVENLESIITGLNEISKSTKVVLPMHPRTKAAMRKFGLSFEGLTTDPLGYFDMLELLKHCEMVITDSGGLQKEAYFNQKPCIIVREETEWVELVRNHYASLTGAKAGKIKEAYSLFKENKPVFDPGLYGENAGKTIYLVIKGFLQNK